MPLLSDHHPDFFPRFVCQAFLPKIAVPRSVLDTVVTISVSYMHPASALGHSNRPDRSGDFLGLPISDIKELLNYDQSRFLGITEGAGIKFHLMPRQIMQTEELEQFPMDHSTIR
jgi:hypothetical protein